MQDNYVCGFLISYDFDKILLINKGGKPQTERQLVLDFCGIGGKIKTISYIVAAGENQEAVVTAEYARLHRIPPEQCKPLATETPHAAMTREFLEETGSEVKQHRWHAFMIKEYKGTKIYFFCSFCSPDEINKIIAKAKAEPKVEGEISCHNMVDILFDPKAYTFDIPYLINMLIRESRIGFLPKLDPEGINSANKKN